MGKHPKNKNAGTVVDALYWWWQRCARYRIETSEGTMDRYHGVDKGLAERLLAEHPFCAVCLRPAQVRPRLWLTLDHVIPRCEGGTDDESNLRVLCVSCNSTKARMSDERFMRYYANRPDRPSVIEVLSRLRSA